MSRPDFVRTTKGTLLPILNYEWGIQSGRIYAGSSSVTEKMEPDDVAWAFRQLQEQFEDNPSRIVDLTSIIAQATRKDNL